MKRFHTTSECLRATEPIVFHSFWRAIIFQSYSSILRCLSVLPLSHTRLFQFEILFHLFLDILVESAFLVEIYITGSAEAFENLYIGFFGAKPIVFHLSCKAITSLFFSSQSLNVFKASKSIPSISSQIAVFATRFSCSFDFSDSKCS